MMDPPAERVTSLMQWDISGHWVRVDDFQDSAALTAKVLHVRKGYGFGEGE